MRIKREPVRLYPLWANKPILPLCWVPETAVNTSASSSGRLFLILINFMLISSKLCVMGCETYFPTVFKTLIRWQKGASVKPSHRVW